MRPLGRIASGNPRGPPPRGVRQRRERLLHLVAKVLEGRRQREPLAEVLGILVRAEAGADRGYLEQDAARLAEVDGPEVEAVDDRTRSRASAQCALAPPLAVARGSA